jgi:hypothetical protein
MANRQLTTGGMIVAGTGVAYLIDSLIPWHRECFDLVVTKTCASENAWGTPFSLLATLLALAVVGEVIAVQLMDQTLPAVGSFTWAQIRLAAAGAVPGLTVIQLLAGDNGLSRSLGVFIGLILAGGMLYGTLVRNKEKSPSATL